MRGRKNKTFIKERVCQNTQVVRPEGAEAPSPGQRPG